MASQQVTSQGGIPTRGDFREWIIASFAANKPLDRFVAELIDPTLTGRRPVVVQDILGVKYTIDYVRNDTHEATLQTASDVGQVFLGTAMKCASCHDHFDNPEWKQSRFLGFAGLFAPHDLERIRCEVRLGERVAARVPFDIPGWNMTPPTDGVERLQYVARWLVDPLNPRFARTMVNRVWKRYLGLGLSEPVDDQREGVAASHPELLDWLTHDFITHDFDVKHLARTILTSQTYQLRYDPRLADRLDPTRRDEPRFFRSPSLRRLTSEQFLDSVRLASAGQLPPGERAYLDTRSTALSRALGRPASRNEVSTARTEDVGVIPALELINGEELRTLIHNSLAFAKPQPRAAAPAVVDRVYRAVLGRAATNDEKKIGAAYLTSAESTSAGVEDLVWALVVGPEFSFIK